MTRRPETLLLHTVYASRAQNGPAVRTALEEAIPDLDLRVARTPPESERYIDSAEIVVASRLPRELLDAAEHLRWIQALSSGVGFYDVDVIRERGIILTNAAGMHAEPIAEQVLAYMLIFERGLHHGFRQQQRHVWERFEGGELKDKTLGVVGVGAIGSRIAELGSMLEMTVLGIKRHLDSMPDAVDEAFAPDRDDLFEVLRRSDYIVVSCRLTDETRGLLGAEEFGAMDDSAVVINIARGEVIDEDALIEALRQHVIRGAGLDVYREEPLPADSPLWELSNVVMTPHMAGSTPRKPERIADFFSENYVAYLDDDPDAMVNRVL